ncbi:MAG: hypothetical protein ACOZAO_04955 [Patescibacteria group bacterium]
MENTNKLFKLITYFVFGTTFLLAIYLILMRITTGSMETAISQFNYYRPWILALSLGFGMQLALSKLLQIKHMETMQTNKVSKVTGATSTATMVACCAHHAVDVLPILGASALASFLGAYTKELFAVGIVFNLFGIGFMLKHLYGANYEKI